MECKKTQIHKSTKYDGVLHYFYREKKQYYDFLQNEIYTCTNMTTNKNNNRQRREKEYKLKKKEYNYIWKEIQYYCSLPNYTPFHIYQIIYNIIKQREEYNINKRFTCSLCDIEKVHSMEYKKNTLFHNTPIIYITPGLAKDHSVFYVCQHFIVEVDKCINDKKVNINNHKTSNKFSIVFDFTSYQMKYVLSNLKVAYHLSSLLQECYPERLDTIYLIDPPSYIKPLLSMMKKMFRTSLYQKMRTITQNEYHSIIEHM